MEQLIEKIILEMKTKNHTEFFTNESYQVCESVIYKMWDEYKIQVNEERKKLLISVWKKNS